MCFCLLADMIFLLDPNNFLMITKKSTSHDALRIVLVDFFCKEIKNGYSYIVIINVVIVGVEIPLQEIRFTNIHRIYKLPFFMEQAEFVI